MLDIGWPELLVVAIVLIVVVGPKDLPPMLRAFGRTTKKLRGMASEFRGQFDEALREAELDDVKQTFSDAKKLNPMQSIRDAVNPLKDTAKDIRSDLEKTVNSKPSSSTPAKVDVPEPTMKLDDSPPKVQKPKPDSTSSAGDKSAQTGTSESKVAGYKSQASKAKSGSAAKEGSASKSETGKARSVKSGSGKTAASGSTASKAAAKKPSATASTGAKTATAKSSGAKAAGKPSAKPAASKTAGAAKTSASKAGGNKPATGKTGAKSTARARKPKQNEGSA
ncbi:MAG: Sec-independent protein translocase protein TatB [Hoeflea sp.]|uniref:Sec-independent protein translocase protein TatB n=1 Tax=Hoeflea sp. TaxID=1940281 RepID=UPI0032EF68ED